MNDIFTIINLLLTIGLAAGGAIAFKAGFSKAASEVQERVINALETENESQRERIKDLEQRYERLDQIIGTMCEALKKRGLIISVDGNIVNISDGSHTQSVRIKGVI